MTWLALDGATRAKVARHAIAARLPLELYIRIATEGARLVDELAARTGRTPEWMRAVLNDAASRPSAVTPLDAPTIAGYARALHAQHAAGKPSHGELALRLPEDMTGAWRRASREANMPLASWVAARIADAPIRCVDWETAAVSECRTLGEWAYASALSAITRSSA